MTTEARTQERVLSWLATHGYSEDILERDEDGDLKRVPHSEEHPDSTVPWTLAFSNWIRQRWKEHAEATQREWLLRGWLAKESPISPYYARAWLILTRWDLNRRTRPVNTDVDGAFDDFLRTNYPWEGTNA